MVAENLDSLYLLVGSHDDPQTGLCLMEAVSYFAGETHSDHPRCVSTLLTRYATSLNDTWDDIPRQALKPLIPLMMGTADDGQDEARSYLALDWLIRVHAPAFLDLAGHGPSAHHLRALPAINNEQTLHQAALPAKKAARAVLEPYATACAERRPADHAAWVTSYAAALYATRASGANAARVAAWDASWGQERAEIFDDIWAAAWFAQWLGAYHANRTTGYGPRNDQPKTLDAMAAAWNEVARVDVDLDRWNSAARIAEKTLAPTVNLLRASALTLFYSLINPAIVAAPVRRSLAEVS